MVQVPTQTHPDVQLDPTPMNPKAAASLGGEIVYLGKGLSSLGEHFEKIRDFSETKKAQASLSEAYNTQIYKMASTDPDIHNLSQKVDEATDSIVEDAAKGITSPETRNNFVDEAKRQIALKDVHIQTIIRDRQIKDARNSLYASIDADIKDAHSLPPGTLQDNRVKGVQDSLDQAEGLGLITPDQNKRLGETQFNKMSVDQVYHDMDLAEHGGVNSEAQFSTIKDQLQKGQNGMYKYLTNEQSENLGNTVNERQEKAKVLQEKQFKDYQIKNEFDALDNYTKGKNYTTSDVSDMVASGKMSPSLGQAWIQYLESPNSVGDKSAPDVKAFGRMAKGIFDNWDKVSTRNSMTEILKKAGAGQFKQEGLFMLIKAAHDRQKDLNTTDGSKGVIDKIGDLWNSMFKKDSKQPQVQQGFERVKNYAGENEDDLGKGAYHYLNEVGKGTDPNVAAQGAIQKIDNIEGLFPNYQSYPEEGKLFYKAGIGYFRVFPNKTWKKVAEQSQDSGDK